MKVARSIFKITSFRYTVYGKSLGGGEEKEKNKPTKKKNKHKYPKPKEMHLRFLSLVCCTAKISRNELIKNKKQNSQNPQ